MVFTLKFQGDQEQPAGFFLSELNDYLSLNCYSWTFSTELVLLEVNYACALEISAMILFILSLDSHSWSWERLVFKIHQIWNSYCKLFYSMFSGLTLRLVRFQCYSSEPSFFPSPVSSLFFDILSSCSGIHNVILLFSAILSDQKVLLCSRSLNRLTESCQALTALLYPLKYGYVLPILW